MNELKQIKFRKPYFLQMLIAYVVSFVSISVSSIIFVILSSVITETPTIPQLIDSIFSILFALLIVCVPISMSLLLCIQFVGLFRYLMYSFKMVIFVSVMLVIINLIINIIFPEFSVRSILLVSVIIVVECVLCVKNIFRSRYMIFQKEQENCHIRPYLNKKIDITLTIVINILLLIPSLLFVFIAFP